MSPDPANIFKLSLLIPHLPFLSFLTYNNHHLKNPSVLKRTGIVKIDTNVFEWPIHILTHLVFMKSMYSLYLGGKKNKKKTSTKHRRVEKGRDIFPDH